MCRVTENVLRGAIRHRIRTGRPWVVFVKNVGIIVHQSVDVFYWERLHLAIAVMKIVAGFLVRWIL